MTYDTYFGIPAPFFEEYPYLAPTLDSEHKDPKGSEEGLPHSDPPFGSSLTIGIQRMPYEYSRVPEGVSQHCWYGSIL